MFYDSAGCSQPLGGATWRHAKRKDRERSKLIGLQLKMARVVRGDSETEMARGVQVEDILLVKPGEDPGRWHGCRGELLTSQ
jgi:hypothetical protein